MVQKPAASSGLASSTAPRQPKISATPFNVPAAEAGR